MSILRIFKHFRHVAKTAQKPLPGREEYERLATDAYTACCEWFGTPPDEKCPFFLTVSPDNTSGCGYLFGQYIISLASSLDTPEQRCETIGHEIYHRVTCRRHGLRSELWIDEVMAFLAAQWFLRKHGYHDYARKNRRRYVIQQARVDIAALRRFHRPRVLLVLKDRSEYFPENFYPDVRRVAIALNWVVSSGDLCRLPWAHSLAGWLHTLPEDCQACVCRVLELPGEDGGVPLAEEWHVKMGMALQVLGRFDEAVTEFRTAQTTNAPQDGLFFNIALCLERANHLDKAREAYVQAAQYNTQDEWATYNLALLFKKQKNFPAAIEWFQTSLKRKPDWPQALYYLGAVLAHDGQIEEARQCWQRIVELNDGWYSVSAHGSLDAWKDVATHVITDA